MKILIISDTHGFLWYLNEVLKKVGPIDMLIHCGDIQKDEEPVKIAANCPVYMVAGNNDLGTLLEKEIFLDIGKYHIMVTHGHRYSVGYGLDMLAASAKKKGADIVMFGHTHVPLIKKIDNVTLVNPGSITIPRQSGRRPSYAFMEIDRDGEAHFTVAELMQEQA